MNRTMLGLAITAGLLASSMLAGHTPAAHAASPPSVTCGMTNVDVTATATDHHYVYSYGCYFFGTAFPMRVIADVTADYDTTDQTASEFIHADYAGEEYNSTWNCASDPWAWDNRDDSDAACSLHFHQLTGDQQSRELVDFWGCYGLGGIAGPGWAWGAGRPVCPNFDRTLPGVGPISVPLYDPASWHVLAAQLQNALKQVSPVDVHPGRITTSEVCIACVLASTASGGSATTVTLPAPAGFSGQRDNVFGTTDILNWQPVSGADYYKLTAQSHASATPLAVSGGNDIAGAAISFVVDGTAAQVQGGTDFFLQACSVANGCGATATTTVVGPS